ncbi:tripartite tricarboxylate transporter permease [Mameliella sediminis]|uniref:tripartite tricarboxylate transporter permease n=1 Tax=Mameliella sediminis TaxID=2836866 RepID=UPI001C449CE4|nr:tripartite tricarboxylate transporter permease [Mameliella sediminis]MBY6115325.1 tripartite tricarboxylate transporter permease [Antarctobacter heliothermus]MBY6144610.1 tripartite tricarboxylate transporter permease [Mameliella alba]MBV7395724.1 tripartite tricarboxylate transporter permease [Mameliella sediminis]MBY6160137.1 tripartite tricarboxylate transporter permease [Mameliella alba]MBY6168607.1 tripartite tricarboxylate transporter permease [Mameliella alba]
MDAIATALPALGEAWALILQPIVLGYLVLGVVMGLAVGVFPGLGGIAGLSLLLPFMFGMDPVLGLALMIGMVAVVPTSDTFASVLMGIPGSSASQATVLDGFPLAKKGQAARALSAAFTSSLFGGLVGALFLTLFILVARPIVLAFGLPEMLMITVLGLSMVAVLAGRVALKGLAAAGLGMMIGTIGEADAGGSLRMATYDIPYLTDGLKLVIVGLGIFAVPEIISLLRQDRSIAKDAKLGAGWGAGVKDWVANKWLSVRCSLIGVLVGVIPGLGGSVVDWIAYGHAVQTTKDKSNFGKGEIRGVIGPESSNNAKEGGGLVPTLLFGIPGSGSMAIFIGAIALLGSGDIEVGPSMLRDNLDITYSIVWLLALANVVGTLLCIAASGGIAKLTTIRFTYLAPFLFMLISFAAFQSGQNFEDLLALFAIGLIGIFLRRFDWSRPAFLIGFVLSNPVEKFSNQAFQIASFRFRKSFEEGMDYIFSPIVIVLIIVTVVSVVLGIRQAKSIMAEGDVQSGSKRAPLVFLLVIVAYLVVALVNANMIPDYNLTDKIVPLVIGGIALGCCLIMLVQMMMRPETDVIFADKEIAGEDADAPYGLWSTLAWFAGLIAATWFVGFILALVGFLVAFLRVRAGAGWAKTLILTACGIGFMCLMAWSLNRDFPPGLLQAYVDLPWPLK